MTLRYHLFRKVVTLDDFANEARNSKFSSEPL